MPTLCGLVTDPFAAVLVLWDTKGDYIQRLDVYTKGYAHVRISYLTLSGER
jgi:hypothetical protein